MFGGIDILVNCGGISVRHDYPKTVIVTFLFTNDIVAALSVVQSDFSINNFSI